MTISSSNRSISTCQKHHKHNKFYTNIQLKGSVKELNVPQLRNSLVKPVMRAAENLQLYRVVWFFRPRSSCTTHLMLFSERLPIYALCMMISGGRTEQHVIIAGFLTHHWLYDWFSSAENVRRNMHRVWRSRVEEPNESRLEYIDIRSVY